MIRIRFVWGDDALSRLIRAGEHDGDAPTHAEAVLPDGSLLGAHLQGGVEIRPAGYDEGTYKRALVVNIDPPKISFATHIPPALINTDAAFLAFITAQVGKPYDLTAIAGYALDRNWREDDSWFCSELQATALEVCGYLPRLSTSDNHVSPRDLLLVLSGRVAIPQAA